tara:strand:+ start:88 stop:600 length:513 start_codon:yes stop_codon:yes gene_type:complete
MNIDKKTLLNIFEEKKINYKIYSHEPLYTVEDSFMKRGQIDGAHTKNLFLKNKKNNFYLFSCLESTPIDLKYLRKKLEMGNISFAKNEYLKEMLGVLPGAVTPFGLLNDINKEIRFYMDKKLLFYDKINFHPLENTSTVTLTTRDFMYFMKLNNKLVNIYNFDNYSTENI